MVDFIVHRYDLIVRKLVLQRRELLNDGLGLCLDDSIVLGAVAALGYTIDDFCLPTSTLRVFIGLWEEHSRG